MATSSDFKGPRKALRLPLVVVAPRQGFRLFDYRLRQLFETADIISEGASKGLEGVDGESAYFGTTNIVLAARASDSAERTVDPHLLVRIFAWDPHVRVRALRIACREARVRANGIIDRVRTEIFVTQAETGIRIHVDLEARVVSTFPRSVDVSMPATQRARRRSV